MSKEEMDCQSYQRMVENYKKAKTEGKSLEGYCALTRLYWTTASRYGGSITDHLDQADTYCAGCELKNY